MPSDTYILTISDAGVSVPSSHASTHLTGGSDAIPVATTSTSGLMSSAIFDQHVINTAKVSNATHTGDVTDASGVLTVSKINGVALAPLGTGILRMSSGIPSLATDGTQFPTLNQSTTGNAATATTATNLAGGSAGTVPYQTAVNTTAQTSVGTSGQILKSNGTSAPTWTNVVDVIPTLNQSTTGNAATATLATTATTATTATNIVGGSVGSIPYQTGSGATTMLSAGASGYVLKSNGSAAPSWSALDISSGTSGTLPVASGGTGAATFTAGILKGNGTSAFTTVSAPTGAIVGTSDTQTLTNKTMGSGTTFSSAIGVSNGGTGQTTFTAGIVKAAGTTGFTTVTAPIGDVVGTSDTQTLTNKTLSTGTVYSTVPATAGGTGQTSFAVGDLLYADTTTSVAKLADVAAGSVLLSGGLDTAPSYGKVGLTTHVTGTLQVVNGGTGLSGFSAGILKSNGGIGNLTTVVAPAGDLVGTTATQTLTNKTLTSPTLTSPTLTEPVLGTPASGSLINCTDLPLDIGVTGVLPLTKGGTGYSQTAIGELYLALSAATSIASLNNWVKVLGTTSLVTGGANLSTPPTFNNRLRYDGTPNRKIFVSVSGSLHGSNGDEIKVAVAKGGTQITSSITQITTTGAGNVLQFSCQCIVEMATNEYVELFVNNTSSTNAVTFDFFNICAYALI